MQTKSSYGVLKWTFLLGVMASLGACVVTSGDGDDDDDTGDGGESGSSTTAGKNGTAGKGGSATAGTSTGGNGGSATAGTSAGGAGGDASSYVPGVCTDDLAVPSMPRDTALNADDETPAFACRKCLKVSCDDAWATCYGEAPTSACGYGSTEDAPGQFECIRSCFVADMSADDINTVLSKCEDQCLDQCADKDQGFATDDTQELLGCGQEECFADCFSPE